MMKPLGEGRMQKLNVNAIAVISISISYHTSDQYMNGRI